MFKFVAVFLIFMVPSFSFAQTRGSHSCGGSLEDAENDYNADRDNPHNATAYGACLILYGHEVKGLALLKATADASIRHVKAAYVYAQALKTDTTFQNGYLTREPLLPVIEAYDQVLTHINTSLMHKDVEDRYPYNGNLVYERSSQIMLRTYEKITWLYFQKFLREAQNSEDAYTSESAVPAYAEQEHYTMDSLKKVVSRGEDCLGIRYHEYYHEIDMYRSIVGSEDSESKGRCGILRDTAMELLAHEQDRVDALHQCGGADLFECSVYSEKMKGVRTYSEIKDTMVAIIAEGNSQIKALAGKSASSSE